MKKSRNTFEKYAGDITTLPTEDEPILNTIGILMQDTSVDNTFQNTFKAF